jgi:hypothetical protein
VGRKAQSDQRHEAIKKARAGRFLDTGTELGCGG